MFHWAIGGRTEAMRRVDAALKMVLTVARRVSIVGKGGP